MKRQTEIKSVIYNTDLNKPNFKVCFQLLFFEVDKGDIQIKRHILLMKMYSNRVAQLSLRQKHEPSVVLQHLAMVKQVCCSMLTSKLATSELIGKQSCNILENRLPYMN